MMPVTTPKISNHYNPPRFGGIYRIEKYHMLGSDKGPIPPYPRHEPMEFTLEDPFVQWVIKRLTSPQLYIQAPQNERTDPPLFIAVTDRDKSYLLRDDALGSDRTEFLNSFQLPSHPCQLETFLQSARNYVRLRVPKQHSVLLKIYSDPLGYVFRFETPHPNNGHDFSDVFCYAIENSP